MTKIFYPLIFTLIGVTIGFSSSHLKNPFISEAQAANSVCKVQGGNNDVGESAAAKFLNSGYRIVGFSSYVFPSSPNDVIHVVLACK